MSVRCGASLQIANIYFFVIKCFWLNLNIFPFQITNQSAAVKWTKSVLSLLGEMVNLAMVTPIFSLLLLSIHPIISASTIKGNISKERNRAVIELHIVLLCDDGTCENYAKTPATSSLLSQTIAISPFFF